MQSFLIAYEMKELTTLSIFFLPQIAQIKTKKSIAEISQKLFF